MEELIRKIEELEKRVAALEEQVQAQQIKFVPEDSDNGISNSIKYLG